MAVQYNDVTAIGDVFIVKSNTPVMGVQAISGYTDVLLNETGTRFFTKEFKYSTNGITYSDWLELSNTVLQNTFIGETDIFDIQYRYTRAGTDTTGILTFVSISLLGVIEEVSNPKIFTDLYFNKFFNYNDSSVLNWALNVLNKLYKRGVVSNYMDRGEVTNEDDEDYLALFGALTHFFAILVRYAREFRDFTLNESLLLEYLKQKNIFLCDDISLSDLQNILSNLYLNFLERGTNVITKETGVDGRTFDGELLRLICKDSLDEFLFGIIETEKTIWNVNNNSPLYKGTKSAINLVKAYEPDQDVQDLGNYPLLESSYITKYTDSPKEVIRVLDAAGTVISGIGDAENQNKLILIDTRLSYEITFQVKQVILGDYLHLKVNLYDSDEVLLLDSPISATTGAQTNLAIEDESLNQNDEYYFIRVILFNQITEDDSKYVLDIGFGNHLILNNSDAKYMSIELGSNITSGGTWDTNNDLRIYDFKVRPLVENFPNGFVMVSSIITAFIENNSEDTNQVVENNINRFLIPYSSTFKNHFLDELFVESGTPLQITVTVVDETIIGANNGIISIVAIGGTPPYLYSIDNGVTFNELGVFTNLSPGTYDIVVEDAATVQVTDTATVAVGVSDLDFQTFTTSASSIGVADGEITILASGGSSPYYYSINGVDFFVSNVFSGLFANTYTAYVRDSIPTEINKPVILDAVRDKTVTFNVEDELTNPLENVNIEVISENYLTNPLGTAIIYLSSGSYNFVLTKTGYTPTYLNNTAITSDILIDVEMIESLAATYDFEDNIHITLDTLSEFSSYQLVDILPSGSNRNGASIRVKVDYYILALSGGIASSFIYYGIGSDAVTEPTTWIFIDSVETEPNGGDIDALGTATIVVADGEYLFLKNDLNIVKTIHYDSSTVANFTLIDGSVVSPATGTAEAFGSPLVWNKTFEFINP
jgi:hypothetical protein